MLKQIRRRAGGVIAALLAVTAVQAPMVAAAEPTDRWSLAQLEQWRDQTMSVLSQPGVVFTDVDEARGRLAIGVIDPALHEAPVRLVMSSVGVPHEAVAVLTTGPIHRAGLRDRHRPTVGGLQIEFQTGFLGLGTGSCTLGFGVRLLAPNQDGFITNSHCSRTQGSVDNGRYWQATRPITDGDQAGTEIADPPYFTGGSCPPGRRCRQSDSALIQATEAAQIAVGTIARVSENSLVWDGITRYQVRGKAPRPPLGRVLTKVGRTTGRSSGVVTTTCAHINVTDSDITLLCDDIVRADVDFGDSGSPVFAVTDATTNDVELVGILWGKGVIDGVLHFVYSPIGDVEADLGAPLTVTFGS